MTNKVSWLLGSLAFIVSVSAIGQEPPEAKEETRKTEPPEKRPITPKDYGRFESLGFFGTALSPDGRWIAYGVTRVDEEYELRLRMLGTDETEALEYGQRPQFSADSKWLAYQIGYSPKQREKAADSKKPLRSKLGLRNILDGETEEVEGVQSFAFSDDGRFLIMRRYPAKQGGDGSPDLVLRDLESMVDTRFGNVKSYRFNDDGTLLAMLIDAEDEVGNGVQVYDAATGMLRTLDSAEAKYIAMSWCEDAADLVVARELEHEEDEDAPHLLLAWRGLDGPDPEKFRFDHTVDDDFPSDFRVVDFAGLQWSDDGEAIFFGIRAWDNKPQSLDKTSEDEDEAEQGDQEDEKAEESSEEDEAEGDDDDQEEPEDADGDEEGGSDEAKTLRESLDDPAGVEVWHARDIDIIPLQKKRAERDKRENFLSAWWLEDGDFVQLGDELTEEVRLVDGHRHAVGSDNTPHEREKMFGPTLYDIYVIDTRTGVRSKVLDAVKYFRGSSPDGRYLSYVRDGHLWTYDIETKSHANLTAGVEGADFINDERNALTDESPPYGRLWWTEDGSQLLQADRYDLYLFRSDGSEVQRLSDGADEGIEHRRIVFGTEEEDLYLDLSQPIYVSLYGDRSKQFGVGRIRPGGEMEQLVWLDEYLGRITKAEEADVFAVVREDFDDAPDIFVTDADMDDLRQVSSLNDFQDEYLWGREELIDFTNANGEELQGALFYPAGYEEGKTYPMIVYIYEERSQGVHQYTVPSERNPYNRSVFTAEGYFVFEPDIVYREQNPGISAVECVVPAVEEVLRRGIVDPERVGLVGHSWGAYQSTFIVTQTDLFAAAVAGAPLTNMMSMSMSIYWNTGQTDAWIFHESQGRMDRPFWEDIGTYMKNSPIFNIDRLTTPLLVAFGDEDGAVDFNQGVEMYNAARLAGKPLVMLVYPGENHSLAKKPNQVDYHYRILEWFGHYLKGESAESWIVDGQPYLDRQREIERLKKERESKGRKTTTAAEE